MADDPTVTAARSRCQPQKSRGTAGLSAWDAIGGTGMLAAAYSSTPTLQKQATALTAATSLGLNPSALQPLDGGTSCREQWRVDLLQPSKHHFSRRVLLAPASSARTSPLAWRCEDASSTLRFQHSPLPALCASSTLPVVDSHREGVEESAYLALCVRARKR